MIKSILEKNSGKQLKIKVYQLQRICGFLNFLGRAIVPGRAFNRRLYSQLSGKLKAHHHIRVTAEMKADLLMWLKFIEHPAVFSRPFFDYSDILIADELDFFVDASKNPLLGFGGYCFSSWMQCHWDGFIEKFDPSIQYLELYAMTAAILAWMHRFKNRRVVVFTDNESVMNMLNTNSSSCKNCMILIRIIVLHCLIHNIRFYGKHVRTHLNGVADSLSRFQVKRFRRLTRKLHMDKLPTPVPKEIWPIEKMWLTTS